MDRGGPTIIVAEEEEESFRISRPVHPDGKPTTRLADPQNIQ
jgi:hypothetical protein